MPGTCYIFSNCCPLSLLMLLLFCYFVINGSFISLAFQATIKPGEQSYLICTNFPERLSWCLARDRRSVSMC